MLKHVTESISGNSKDDRQVAAIHGELSFQCVIKYLNTCGNYFLLELCKISVSISDVQV